MTADLTAALALALDAYNHGDSVLTILADLEQQGYVLDAAPAEPGLDVERLARALHEYGGVCKSRYGKKVCAAGDHSIMAEAIAAAYAAEPQP